MNKSDLIKLKYISQDAIGIDFWALTSIINNSITSNKLNSITGILYFDKGYFGQILEGTISKVDETWSRIKNDSRNSNIELLDITEIEERHFQNWSMKLFDAQEFSVEFPQFSEYLVKIDDTDLKNLETLKLLWREI